MDSQVHPSRRAYITTPHVEEVSVPGSVDRAIEGDTSPEESPTTAIQNAYGRRAAHGDSKRRGGGLEDQARLWNDLRRSYKRSPSPLPEMYPGFGALDQHDEDGFPRESKKLKREGSADLLTMSDSDLNTSDCAEMLAYPDNAEHRPLVDYSWNADVPRGDPPPDVDRAVIDDNAPPHETTVQEPVPARISSIAAAWLLDPAIAAHSGMLVEVRGSNQLRSGAAWHGGDYEGAHGVVLSVHNTGADNESFPSTAQVKFRKPLNSYNGTFAVPVFLLRPVQPDAVGQHALIVGGEHKGDTAKLLEEVSGGWFVDAAYDYFDVESEDLVRMFTTDAGE